MSVYTVVMEMLDDTAGEYLQMRDFTYEVRNLQKGRVKKSASLSALRSKYEVSEIQMENENLRKTENRTNSQQLLSQSLATGNGNDTNEQNKNEDIKSPLTGLIVHSQSYTSAEYLQTDGAGNKEKSKISTHVPECLIQCQTQTSDKCHLMKTFTEDKLDKTGNGNIIMPQLSIQSKKGCESKTVDDRTLKRKDETRKLIPQLSVQSPASEVGNHTKASGDKSVKCKDKTRNLVPQLSIQSQASEEGNHTKALEDKALKRRHERRIFVPQLSVQSQASEEGNHCKAFEDKAVKRREERRIFVPQLSVQSQASEEGSNSKTFGDKTLKRKDETRLFVPQLSVQSQYSTKKLHLFFAGVVSLVVISVMCIVLIVVIKAVLFSNISGDQEQVNYQILTTESVTFIEYGVKNVTEESM